MATPQYRLIVTARVDEAVEAAWNEWYDRVHLPDALACPGVLSGTRYVSVGEIKVTERGTPHPSLERVYTTIYEIAGPDVTGTPEFQRMRGWAQFAPHVRSETKVIASVSA